MSAIDFSQPLKTFDGQKIVDPEGTVTLRRVCETALTNRLPGDENDQNGVNALKRYQLARIISRAKKPIELASERITMLKDRIGRSHATLIAGQALEMLDPALVDEESRKLLETLDSPGETPTNDADQ
jgi:hypothetical protein